jgi:hypothetical protein
MDNNLQPHHEEVAALMPNEAGRWQWCGGKWQSNNPADLKTTSRRTLLLVLKRGSHEHRL